jgi:short-subunit dehydrogenase
MPQPTYALVRGASSGIGECFARALVELTHLLLPAMLEARRGGGLVVPRLLNKLSIFSQRFAPRGLVTKVAGRNFRV